jgi:hypothetical protein
VIATCAPHVPCSVDDVVLEFDRGKLKESVGEDRLG